MKSIKIKLNCLNSTKKQKLLNIFETLSLISKEYLPLRRKELETKTFKNFKYYYHYFRSKYPFINSMLISDCIRNQDFLVKSFISICKKKHKLVTFPENSIISIPLRSNRFHLEYNKKTKSFNAWLKWLKIYFPLKLCDYHIKSLENLDSIRDSSIIKDEKGEMYLRLCFKTKINISDNNKFLGIDIGIINPIVCSDKHIIGSGAFIKHKKIEFSKKRAKHQKSKENITKKQSRWTNDLNHKLSRSLIDYCSLQEIGVLVLEDLKGSHLSNRKFRKYNWAFKDLINKIKYKAEYAGLKVISVDPKYTSQTCSSCGQKDKTNRISQSLYECSSCGLKTNADINAAKNILNLSVQNGSPMNPSKVSVVPEVSLIKETSS